MNRPKKRLNLLVAFGLVLIVGLYGVSLFQPTVAFWLVGMGGDVANGWQVVVWPYFECRRWFTMAWEGNDFWNDLFDFCVQGGWVLIPWMANPLLLAGAIFLLLGRWHCAWVAGALAILAALYVPLIRHLNPHEVGDRTMLLRGYYLWLGSMVVLTAVGGYQAVRRWRALKVRDHDALCRPTV